VYDELKPRPGTKVSDRVTIAESASRQDICLYYFGLWGKRKGPTLLLNAAVHGNEVVGVEVVRKIVDEIDPATLTGNLIAVPIVNPMAFTSGLRWDPYDNIDMNRIFPGDPEGTMTERVAHSFYTIFARQADYILDLHSAEFPDELIPHIRVRVDRPTKAYHDLVASTGINAVWKGPSIKGMLQTQAFQNKIPCVTIEIGAAGVITKADVLVGTTAVRNVMAVLGMIDGTASVPDRQIILQSNEAWIRSPFGGIFKPAIDLGQFVKRGDVIGDIIDPTSYKNEDIESPLSGIVTGISHQPIVRSGTRLAMVVDFDKSNLKRHLVPTPRLQNARYRQNEYLVALMKELP
jgi:predicted deacylase